jgi:hypothetical protein
MIWDAEEILNVAVYYETKHLKWESILHYLY